VMAEARKKAAAELPQGRTLLSRVYATGVVALWIAVLAAVMWRVWVFLRN